MDQVSDLTRRDFLRTSVGVGAAAASPYFLKSPALGAEGKAAASSRITVGMIGLGRQAYHANLKPFLRSPDTQVVALCDVDSWRLENALALVDDHYAKESAAGAYRGCRTYRDFREILARDDLDAVMISTPDHWHVLMAVAAVKAGKHVSCEKPLTRSIRQGRILADAVAKHQRVFRTDSEFRSIRHMHRAVELVRNGRIGRLTAIRTGVPQGEEGRASVRRSHARPQPDADYGHSRQSPMAALPLGHHDSRRRWFVVARLRGSAAEP